jgi:DNA-binding transcriptional ArsR family regulator
MQTASSSATLREHVLDLVWSLWAELGVSSWTRHHQQWAIDPEPLIVFTARVSESDRRLRDEAIDWCIRYGGYVSVTRLRNLLKDEPSEVLAAFDTFAAIVNAHSNLSWPSKAAAPVYRPTGRSSLSSFAAPALIALRLRALFGVAARADILRVLVAQPSRSFTASDLVPEVNYTKRNIDNALDSLVMAGLLEVRLVRNQHQYRLADAARLLGFIGERPQVFPRWTPIFSSLAAILDIAASAAGLEPVIQLVEVSRGFHLLAPTLDLAGLVGPPGQISGSDAWTAFMQWADEITSGLARGDASVLRDRPQPHGGLPA